MNALEQLIADRKKSGVSSGRKRFTLARQRAVAKMQKFALADPSFFVLELIQSAIAHGATMLHISSDGEEFKRHGGKFSMAYGGEHYRREELGQLFDFLFTAKGQLENAHLRDLAIGINALLSFAPERIQVLTGDGTLRGSTLMSVEDGGQTVELGRPDEAVRGVQLMARGLRHPSVQGSGPFLRIASNPATIVSVVEERCMLTPVPVVLNGESISGYAADRSLPLFGYKRRTELDEGDLYGTIGLTGSYALRGIRIMVRGVWIETVPHPSDTQGKDQDSKDRKAGYVGGAVSFDRLRKTADHAGIARDGRFRELMARLEPYVGRVRGVAAGQAASYWTRESALSLRETRELVLGSKRVVCLVKQGPRVAHPQERALHTIAKALGIPVLFTAARTVGHLTSLSGGDVDLIEVRPGEQDSVAKLLSAEPRPLPAQPWLVEPIEVPSIGFSAFAAELPLSASSVRSAAKGRPDSSVRIRLLTALTPDSPDFLLAVEIRMAGRKIATQTVPAAHPGHALVVDLPSVAPERLWDSSEQARASVVRALAERAASLAQLALEAAAQSATRNLVPGTVDPKSTPAYKALAIVANNGVLRWELDEEGVAFWITVPDQWEPLLSAQLLRTESGESRTIKQIGQTMSNSGGRVRWAWDDGRSCGDPDALRLNSVELRALTALVGENVPMRILPGHTPDPKDAMRTFRSGYTSAEARFQSVCAEQLAMVERYRRGVSVHENFTEADQGWLTLSEIVGPHARRCEVGRRSARVLQLQPARRTPEARQKDDGALLGLRCTPFELALLGKLGLRSYPREVSTDAVYDAKLLCASEVEEPGLVGAIGVPEDPAVPLVLKLDSSSGTTLVGSAPRKFGVCGRLRATDVTGIDGRIIEECRAVLTRAMVEVANGRDPSGRLTETLLDFAVRHMTLSDDAGHAMPAVSDPIALQILRLPLFPTTLGLPETAIDLLANLRVGEEHPIDDSWTPDRRRFVERLQFLRDQLGEFHPSESQHPLGRPADSPYTRAVNDLIRRYRPDEDGVPISLHLVPKSGCFVVMGSKKSQFSGGPDRSSVEELLGSLDSQGRWTPLQLVTAALLTYAKANEQLAEVTNEHERAFQQRVTGALLKGDLG